MLTNFYTAFSPTCFSLLGLWLVVIQINAAAWLDPHSRERAYAVALYFAAPGTMSLLALIDPTSTVTWRIIFVIVSLLGGVGLVMFGRLRHEHPHDALGVSDHLLQWLTVALYAAIMVLAFIPYQTLHVEGVLLTVLVLLGVHVALRLMFATGAPEPSGEASAANRSGSGQGSPGQKIPLLSGVKSLGADAGKAAWK